MAPFLFIGLTGSTERSEKRLINEDNGRTGPASHSLSRYRVEIGGRRLVHLSAKKNLSAKKKSLSKEKSLAKEVLFQNVVLILSL